MKLVRGVKFDGYRLEDVKKMIVDSPFSFSAQLLEETAGSDALSKACGELIYFLSFCNDVFDLLKRLDGRPMLQSAIWHHYGYLFDKAEIRANLASVIECFSRWEKFVTDKNGAAVVFRHLEVVRAVSQDLTSQRYRSGVLGLLNGVPFSSGYGVESGVSTNSNNGFRFTS